MTLEKHSSPDELALELMFAELDEMSAESVAIEDDGATRQPKGTSGSGERTAPPPVETSLPTPSVEVKVAINSDAHLAAPTALPKCVGELQSLTDSYKFPPSTDADHEHKSSAQLAEELEQLVDGIQAPDDYVKVRDRYCAISVALNQRGLLAPAFREFPKISAHALKRGNEQMLIQRDRIVIDCHWLFCRAEVVEIYEGQWKGLLKRGKPLDMDRLATFAATKIKNESRAYGTLRLTDRQQCQLVALRGDSIGAQFKHLTVSTYSRSARVPSTMEPVERAINRWCEKDRRMVAHRSKYLAYAKAKALLGPGALIFEIAELAGLIMGDPPLQESAARLTLKKLAKKMDEFNAVVTSAALSTTISAAMTAHFSKTQAPESRAG